MGNRRRSRELAMQVLFHLEFSPDDPEDAFELVCESFESPHEIRPYAKVLVMGVCLKRPYLDQIIGEASENWRIQRMARVDRTVLRLSVYEMLFVKEVPAKVAIDEALEIAKKYGGSESGRFVNGVLDNVFKNVLGGDNTRKLQGEGDGA